MSDNGQAHEADWIRAALDEHERPLVRYAQRLTGDLERARDIVQDTFLKLCRRGADELDGHLAEWLYTVCRNKALDVLRKERRMKTLPEETIAVAEKDSAPDETAERRDTFERVLELVGRLPENQREVILLKFQRELSYREIAEVTGHSVSNVGFLIHQGVKTLRHRMKTHHA
jgi:RNA polymerase sigma-70 factor (ECF subfamily)